MCITHPSSTIAPIVDPATATALPTSSKHTSPEARTEPPDISRANPPEPPLRETCPPNVIVPDSWRIVTPYEAGAVEAMSMRPNSVKPLFSRTHEFWAPLFWRSSVENDPPSATWMCPLANAVFAATSAHPSAMSMSQMPSGPMPLPGENNLEHVKCMPFVNSMLSPVRIRCVRFSTERLPFSNVQPSPSPPQYVMPVYGLMAAAFIDLNARDSPLKSKWKSLAAQSSSEAVGILVGCASATGALASESNSIDQLDRLEASAFTPRSGNQ